MTYSEKLVAFVEGWETFKAIASHDPLNPKVVDIGFGHVLRPGENLKQITLTQGRELLRLDLNAKEAAVNSLVHVPLLQHQHDALVSFAFNLGEDIDDDAIPEGLGDSTLLKYVNAAQFDKAALEFPVWNRAGGAPRWGLAKRRFAELMMFTRADYTWRP